MRATTLALLACLTTTISLSAHLSSREAKRVKEAATVLKDIHAVPDKDIPDELWNSAACVAVIPGMKKAAFVFGAEYGKGLMSCRRDGNWTAPVFMKLGKGSWGLQIGAQSIDLVLLVMNESGAEKLLRNKVSLGAEASISGGPVGRNAQAATDIQLKSEILAYSRSQGLFAGIDLSGGVVEADDDDNTDLYGAGVSAREVLFGGKETPPASTAAFMAALRARK